MGEIPTVITGYRRDVPTTQRFMSEHLCAKTFETPLAPVSCQIIGNPFRVQFRDEWSNSFIAAYRGFDDARLLKKGSEFRKESLSDVKIRDAFCDIIVRESRITRIGELAELNREDGIIDAARKLKTLQKQVQENKVQIAPSVTEHDIELWSYGHAPQKW